jgi:hypothetical protein
MAQEMSPFRVSFRALGLSFKLLGALVNLKSRFKLQGFLPTPRDVHLSPKGADSMAVIGPFKPLQHPFRRQRVNNGAQEVLCWFTGNYPSTPLIIPGLVLVPV